MTGDIDMVPLLLLLILIALTAIFFAVCMVISRLEDIRDDATEYQSWDKVEWHKLHPMEKEGS